MVQVDFPVYAQANALFKSKQGKNGMQMLKWQYMCIVYAKHQKASVKALVQVYFPVYALSKQKQNKKTG